MAQQNGLSLKVIALAVICVILLASTIGALALYLPTQTQLSDQQQTIDDLNDQISDLQGEVDSLENYQAQYTALKSQYDALQDDWATLNATYYEYLETYGSIIGLDNSETISSDDYTQELNATTTLWSGSVDYAGYVAVNVDSNVSSTYVEVTCLYSSTYTMAYNQTVGKEGIALFAVLPGTVTVKVGNINEAAGFNATAVYVY